MQLKLNDLEKIGQGLHLASALIQQGRIHFNTKKYLANLVYMV